MFVTIVWLLLIAGLGALELLSWSPRGPTALSSVVRQLGRFGLARVTMVALWALFGWHLFARYTVVR